MGTHDVDRCTITEGCPGEVRYVNTHRTGNEAAGQTPDPALIGPCSSCGEWQQYDLTTGAITRAKGLGR